MEDFSGIQDEKGNAHKFRDFDLQNKASLIKKLKQSDPEFSKWFASHCEAAETAAPSEVVESGSVQGVQGA